MIIINHHNLQEQITQDHSSLFYTEVKHQLLQTLPTIMLHYKFHLFLLFPPVAQVGGNLLFILQEIQTEFSKRFPISRNSPSDVNKRNSILDKHRRFQFDFIINITTTIIDIIITIITTITINIIKVSVNLFYVVIRANTPLDLLYLG